MFTERHKDHVNEGFTNARVPTCNCNNKFILLVVNTVQNSQMLGHKTIDIVV